MSKISAVIIARNEQDLIGQALESLSFCNEIIVVDNGSEDKTREISEKANAKVYEFLSDDFSELRNFGLSKALYGFVLFLDADERIDEELKNSIKDILVKGSDYSAFRLKRKNFYFGSSKTNEWPYIEKIERLFKKEKLIRWRGKLHESPIVEGEIGKLSGYIIHFTHRDLESMLNKTIEWSTTEALLRYNMGHPQITWWRFPRVMFTAFFNSYIKQQGFRAGVVGILESIYQSFSIFITYAKLWELQKNASLKNR